jgi:rubrerythrin
MKIIRRRKRKMNEGVSKNNPLRWIVKESPEGYAWGYCPVCGYKIHMHSECCPSCETELLPAIDEEDI